MTEPQQAAKRYVTRVAWEDRHPKGADLRQAARDSLIRYAVHFELRIVGGIFESYGERWQRVPVPPGGGHHPELWPAGQVPTGVYGWRAEAEVVPLVQGESKGDIR